MNYQITLGYLAATIALISYAPYLRNIFVGKTRPHAFSWLVWSFLAGIAFVAQIKGGGGAGSWVTGVSAGVCFFIFILALIKGHKEIVYFDIFSFLGALISILIWIITDRPLISVILVVSIYLFGYLPTFRKTFYNPNEETITTFALSALKYFVGLIALGVFSPVTFLYPLSVLLMDVSFVGMALIRRQRLK